MMRKQIDELFHFGNVFGCDRRAKGIINDRKVSTTHMHNIEKLVVMLVCSLFM